VDHCACIDIVLFFIVNGVSLSVLYNYFWLYHNIKDLKPVNLLSLSLSFVVINNNRKCYLNLDAIYK